MAETNKSTPICYSTRYELLPQIFHGENKLVDVHGAGYRQLGKLAEVPEIPEHVTESFRRELKGPEINVMVAYPTTKDEKIKPLREVVDKHKQEIERCTGQKVNVTERQFNVENTGVGEQPYHPNGLVGAINRIGEVKRFLLSGNDWKWAWMRGSEPVALMKLLEYDRIFIVSMESDIVDGNDSGQFPYDKPNIIFYEWVTGQMVSGMGRGPGCQPELLQLAKRMGRVLTKDEFGVTYGNVLMLLFSDQKFADGREVEFKASDWHRIVLSGGQDRAFFVTEWCEHMHKALADLFGKCLK